MSPTPTHQKSVTHIDLTGFHALICSAPPYLVGSTAHKFHPHRLLSQAIQRRKSYVDESNTQSKSISHTRLDRLPCVFWFDSILSWIDLSQIPVLTSTTGTSWLLAQSSPCAVTQRQLSVLLLGQ
ncbi:hypothetical protein BGX33_009939 [Mortierella sp. NVP41]|nr:hypothetical protein BGX33_009939 [Mortierella sp. NVP41]